MRIDPYKLLPALFVTRLLIVAAVLLGPGLSRAADCASTSVANLQNTSCVIGDVVFTFGAATLRDDLNTGKTLSDFMFSPIAGDTGFKITGDFENVPKPVAPGIQNGVTSMQSLDMLVTIATVGGQSTLAALTTSNFATIMDSLPSTDPHQAYFASASASFAEAILDFSGGAFGFPEVLNGAFANPGVSAGNGGQCPAVQSCTDSFFGGPVAATNAGEIIAMASMAAAYIDGNGVLVHGSVVSAETDFIVQDGYVAAVPEPTIFANLLAGFGVTVAGLLRRRARP